MGNLNFLVEHTHEISTLSRDGSFQRLFRESNWGPVVEYGSTSNPDTSSLVLDHLSSPHTGKKIDNQFECLWSKENDRVHEPTILAGLSVDVDKSSLAFDSMTFQKSAVPSARVEPILRARGNRVIALCNRDKVSLAEDGGLLGVFVDRALATNLVHLRPILIIVTATIYIYDVTLLWKTAVVIRIVLFSAGAICRFRTYLCFWHATSKLLNRDGMGWPPTSLESGATWSSYEVIWQNDPGKTFIIETWGDSGLGWDMRQFWSSCRSLTIIIHSSATSYAISSTRGSARLQVRGLPTRLVIYII